MTRHTRRPGGATYYPMDGARQCDPLAPDDVIAALDAWAERRGEEPAPGWSDWLGWHGGQLNVPTDRNWEFRERSGGTILHGRGPSILSSGQVRYEWNAGDAPESADHWSPWLEWRGGPCPLPPDVPVDTRSRREIEEYVWRAGKIDWSHDRPDESCRPHVIRFRYRSPNPAGWLPRGDWIPPAELWDEGCPVRCEWHSEDEDGALSIQRGIPGVWHNITHIRLTASQPQAGLPEPKPEPGAVPELPEFVELDDGGDFWMVHCPSGKIKTFMRDTDPDDLDRIAEACTKLAARERARRAGS